MVLDCLLISEWKMGISDRPTVGSMYDSEGHLVPFTMEVPNSSGKPHLIQRLEADDTVSALGVE
jgi:hypothetical protein